jgi:hypothetical protein
MADLLLSDGYLSLILSHLYYVYFVYNILSHYCTR